MDCCKTCRFWLKPCLVDEKEDTWIGQCRRFPPQYLPTFGDQLVEPPETLDDYWCGEFQNAAPVP